MATLPYTKREKQPKSISFQTFPEQFEKLHPERSKAGGVKARSQPKEVRDAVYSAINELFATAHPYCECCHLIWPEDTIALRLHFRDDTHHLKGKDGLLYFDVRWFKSTCRKAHQWIGDHPEEARKLGLLCDGGEWNKQ